MAAGFAQGVGDLNRLQLVERVQSAFGIAESIRRGRAVDASLGPDTIGELVGRTGLDPVVVAGLVDGLAARRLLADPGDGYALTPAGQRVLLEVARARQADLRAFVEGLGPGRRRRIDAALHLLSRELDAR